MATAQFRRGVALHGMKRFGDARLCLNWCVKLNEKEKGLTLWVAKVRADYEAAEREGREECVKCSVQEVPEKVEVGKAEVEVKGEEKGKENGKLGENGAGPTPVSLLPTPKEKIKHDFYQSTDKVTISIMAKGVPKDKAEINIQEGSVRYIPIQKYPFIKLTSR